VEEEEGGSGNENDGKSTTVCMKNGIKREWGGEGRKGWDEI
jgi:hypothetical protein